MKNYAAEASRLQSGSSSPDLNAERHAGWLLSRYDEPVWTVTDTRSPLKQATIDFRMRLPDGRILTDATSFYVTIKEYAWWVRDSRYSRIDDAPTHARMVTNLMYLAYGLSLRNIWSFAEVQPIDLEQLVEDCRYGTDAVLHASERVEEYLKRLAHASKLEPQPFGGLPRYIRERTERNSVRHVPSLHVHSEKVMAACNLPSGARLLPRVSALIREAAQANGLTPRSQSTTSSKELEALPNQTVQALQRWLDPVEQLYAMRRRIIGDAITFKPFPRGAARLAALKGVGVERTPIPPPSLALFLFEQAARWMLDDTKVKAMQLDRISVRRMATACWIIIAGFTARRREEIAELQAACLRGDDESGWWLCVYIAKTLQRNEWIPVPTLVVRAVGILSTISAAAREMSKNEYLFQWRRADGTVSQIDVAPYLDEFAGEVGVPLHKPRGGAAVVWHWHPHQFRRFFAVLYFYRFEGATVEVLSHHLRHFSLDMTRRYITMDTEVAALWNDVEWGYTRDVARSIVAGERSIAGAAGLRLRKIAQRLVDFFRRKLLVSSPERVGASLALIMRRGGMVLTPKPWVTCTCPATHDAATQAACRRGRPLDATATGPDFAHAGPTVCCSCPHAMTQQTKLPFVDTVVTHLSDAVESGARAGTVFGALERAKLVELRKARATQYGGTGAITRPADDLEAGK